MVGMGRQGVKMVLVTFQWVKKTRITERLHPIVAKLIKIILTSAEIKELKYQEKKLR